MGLEQSVDFPVEGRVGEDRLGEDLAQVVGELVESVHESGIAGFVLRQQEVPHLDQSRARCRQSGRR